MARITKAVREAARTNVADAIVAAPVKAVAAIALGSIVTVRGKSCRVFKVHDFGTVDVEEINGPGAWRVSGLMPAVSSEVA